MRVARDWDFTPRYLGIGDKNRAFFSNQNTETELIYEESKIFIKMFKKVLKNEPLIQQRDWIKNIFLS